MPDYSTNPYSYNGNKTGSRSGSGRTYGNTGRNTVRRSRPRRRRRRNYDGLKLIGILVVTAALIFGIVKISDAIRKPAEPEYYIPTLITKIPDETVNPADPSVNIVVNDPSGGSSDPMESPSEEPTEAPVQQAVENTIEAEPTLAATAYVADDSGYFPTEGQSASGENTNENAVRTGEARRATIRFAGDIVADKEILGTAYDSSTDKYVFTKFFSMIKEQLSNADFTVLNVDGSMGGKKFYKYGYSGYPQFNTPPTLLYALLDAGVDCLSLANNHCLDGWFDGLKQTIINCDHVGMKHFGAYGSQEAYDTPEIFDINGIKVGMLDYTQTLNSMDTAGVDPNALIYGLRRTKNADYAGDIKKLRSAGAEIVVVYMHWGAEYLLAPDNNQVNMATTIANAGADVIIGGHPHTPQAAGWKKVGDSGKCLLVYSLGNFLSEHRNEMKAKTDSGYIFEFTLQENPETGKIEVVSPKYIPIAVWRVGKSGSYDYRVVSVDAILANRPSGMNDEAFRRIREISTEMDALINSKVIQRIAY